MIDDDRGVQIGRDVTELARQIEVDLCEVTPVSDPATDAPVPGPPVVPPRRRRVLSVLRTTSVTILTILLVLGLVGHFARDRTVWLAGMMYLPILPLGVVAVVLALVPRRQSRRARLPAKAGSAHSHSSATSVRVIRRRS